MPFDMQRHKSRNIAASARLSMSVLFENNGMFLISAIADFIICYTPFKLVLPHRHPPPFPPTHSDVIKLGNLLPVAGSEALYLKWGKSAKVLQIQRQLVDMNVIFRPQLNNVHAILMSPSSKKLRGHIDSILSDCPLRFLADTIA